MRPVLTTTTCRQSAWQRFHQPTNTYRLTYENIKNHFGCHPRSNETAESITDGKLYYPSADDYTMPGLRGYFTLPETTDAEAVKISLTIDGVTDDSDATGISAVDAQAETTTGTIYTVSGQRVGNSLEALPSGLYIIGGKKVIVK